MTAAEYLPLEREASFRSDLCDGIVRKRPASTLAHNTICSNLTFAIETQLRAGGLGCRTLNSNLRVGVPLAAFYSYPDLSILCGKPQFDPLCDRTLTNPQIIIEIASPQSVAYDAGRKFQHYRKAFSVREFVLVLEGQSRIVHHWCDQTGTWKHQEVDGPEAIFEVATVPVRVPLADVYRDVEFPPPTLKPRTLSET